MSFRGGDDGDAVQLFVGHHGFHGGVVCIRLEAVCFAGVDVTDHQSMNPPFRSKRCEDAVVVGSPATASNQANCDVHVPASSVHGTQPLTVFVLVSHRKGLGSFVPTPPALIVEPHEFVHLRCAMNPSTP